MDLIEAKEKIIKYIETTVKKSGAKGVVIGLSGGIDSSVVASLAVEALGRENVFGVILPCHSLEDDYIDAIEVARFLKLEYSIVDLSKVYDSFILANKEKEVPNSLAFGNIKPRLRMTELYFIGGKMSYLVIGTTNKSEWATGYFTKYGDGGVDFEPIGDLLKKEVFALGRILNLPERVLSKSPSAGIIGNQTDEEEMGFSYEELDKYIESGEGSKEVVSKISKLFNGSRHKCYGPRILNLNRDFFIDEVK